MRAKGADWIVRMAALLEVFWSNLQDHRCQASELNLGRATFGWGSAGEKIANCHKRNVIMKQRLPS